MPAAIRLTKKELKELIEKIEEPGCDISELQKLLAEVEEAERLEKPARPTVPPEARPVRRREAAPRIMVEEPTTEERLEAEVGGLFPEGITEPILAEVIEFDRNHTLAELKKMAVEAGFSPSGAKKELAAKLIAKGIR